MAAQDPFDNSIRIGTTTARILGGKSAAVPHHDLIEAFIYFYDKAVRIAESRDQMIFQCVLRQVESESLRIERPENSSCPAA